jgi:hypothetical protein
LEGDRNNLVSVAGFAIGQGAIHGVIVRGDQYRAAVDRQSIWIMPMPAWDGFFCLKKIGGAVFKYLKKHSIQYTAIAWLCQPRDRGLARYNWLALERIRKCAYASGATPRPVKSAEMQAVPPDWALGNPLLDDAVRAATAELMRVRPPNWSPSARVSSERPIQSMCAPLEYLHLSRRA